MTDVRNDNFTLIHSVEDALPLYKGNELPDEQQRMGFETEICLYSKNADGKPVAASSAECSVLLKYLEDLGHAPQLEMASAIEYASPAFRVTETASLTKEITQSWKDYIAAIKNFGMTPSDSALLPFVTLDSAKENLVDRDRARGLVKGMSLFKTPEFLKVTLLCTSTQVSLSYKNPDDLYNLLTTAYALQAVIYTLFGNYPSHIEGNPEKINFNPRAKFYEAFGKDGGIPDSLLTAKSGDEFIRKHVQQVFDRELLFYYDHSKNIIYPEKPIKFGDLASLDLNTRSNYDLAESFIYTDIKVCNIRDENGLATGKRIEIRGFDAGELGVSSSIPFIHAVLRNVDTHESVKGLLLQYGISHDFPDWKENLLFNRHAAANHGGKYLDVPFGNGNLKDFCRDLGNILKIYAVRNPDMATPLSTLIHICESGLTVAEQKAAANYESSVAAFFESANDNAVQSIHVPKAASISQPQHRNRH